MILSHKHQFLFIKTKKTAGSSIEIYLQNFIEPNARITSDKTEKYLEDGLWTHMGISHLEQREEYKKYLRDYFVFTVVRNPMERIISEFFWSDRDNYYKGDFDKFLKGQHIRGTFNWPLLVDSMESFSRYINYVVYFEWLFFDLNAVLNVIDLTTMASKGDFPKDKVGYRTDKRPWYDFMNNNQIDYIYKNFVNEIKLHRQLGYDI